MPTSEPVYLQSLRSGLLRRKVEQAFERLSDCTLCPRMCRVDGGDRRLQDGSAGVRFQLQRAFR
jgi:uncharacterized Fe-S radical SAM superfamily protein PflX